MYIRKGLGDADSTMSVGDQKGSAAITRRKKKDLSKETAEEARRSATCCISVPLDKLFAGETQMIAQCNKILRYGFLHGCIC